MGEYRPMFLSLRRAIAQRALVRALARRELSARYRGGVLGFLWSMVNPLLLLKDGSLTAEERHSYLSVATRHCERLGKLVRDLFELTRLEAREIRPRLERFPLAELVQDVAQKFELQARKAGQHLVTEIAPETRWVAPRPAKRRRMRGVVVVSVGARLAAEPAIGTRLFSASSRARASAMTSGCAFARFLRSPGSASRS